MARNTPLKNSVYRDLDLNFRVHPNSKNLITLTGDDAVKAALKNLLQYNNYEKPFYPDFGSGIRSLLFENFSPQTAVRLKNQIIQTINNFEPRIRLDDVLVVPSNDQNKYEVTIKYFVINEPTSRTARIFLERLR